MTSNGQKQGVTVTLIGNKNTAPYIESNFSLSKDVNFGSRTQIILPVRDSEG